MFDRLADLVSEHAELEQALADPSVHSDQERARTLGRRYAELTPIVHAYQEWQQISADEQAARELAREDSSFADEAAQLAARREELEAQLEKLLVPRDPNDARDLILEVKAGEGGEESALFAADLLRMYQRYAERRGWKAEILDSTLTGLGGVKDATVADNDAFAFIGCDALRARLSSEAGKDSECHSCRQSGCFHSIHCFLPGDLAERTLALLGGMRERNHIADIPTGCPMSGFFTLVEASRCLPGRPSRWQLHLN